jgi:RND superfamily putative drug exporter
VLTLNGQSQGILDVLVFGAGTDYALLIIARFREELRRHEDSTTRCGRRCAGRPGDPRLRRHGHPRPALPAVSDLSSNRSLGPVAAHRHRVRRWRRC